MENKSDHPTAPPVGEMTQYHPKFADPLCENCERLRDVLHRDRSGLADGIDRIRKIVKGWWWIPAGEWACYDYTEQTAETIRTEFSNCLRQVEEVAESTMKASGSLAHAECCGYRPASSETCPDCPHPKHGEICEVFTGGFRCSCMTDHLAAPPELCEHCEGFGTLPANDETGRPSLICSKCYGKGYRPASSEAKAYEHCIKCSQPTT